MDAPNRDGDELGEAPRTGAPDELTPLAGILPSLTAVKAVSARDLRVDGNTSADQGLSDGPSSGDDHSAQLVTHDQRWRASRTSRSDAVQVRAANAGRLDPHHDLVASGLRGRDCTNLEIERRCIEQRLHGLRHADVLSDDVLSCRTFVQHTDRSGTAFRHLASPPRE
jgi:hypothetical protein